MHSIANSAISLPDWRPVAQPPDLYDLVLLLFSDGRTRRGTWNGKLWWGYDEKRRRSCALSPIAWTNFVA